MKNGNLKFRKSGRKKYMKDYEYFKIDSASLQQDYTPTETEIELFKWIKKVV